MKHLLTVTIPSYKQPEQLKRALHALSVQTFQDFSVVIIDDASLVNFESILHEYKNLDIKVLLNQKNIGAMRNMEKSITLETDSKYIFSHHEDDYIKDNYLEVAIDTLEKNSTVSFVIGSPIWVKKKEEYHQSFIEDRGSVLFNAQTFMTASLNREPFIFGSVIYRRSHLLGTFDLDTYYTLCDKIFLSEILLKNNSAAAYIKEPSIYVRDHSLDEKDSRSEHSKVEYIVNFFHFYKKNLREDTSEVKKLLTNGLLLGYSNLPGKTSLIELYRKQKKYQILRLESVNIVGLYALISIVTSNKLSHALLKSNLLKKLFIS